MVVLSFLKWDSARHKRLRFLLLIPIKYLVNGSQNQTQQYI